MDSFVQLRIDCSYINSIFGRICLIYLFNPKAHSEISRVQDLDRCTKLHRAGQQTIQERNKRHASTRKKNKSGACGAKRKRKKKCRNNADRPAFLLLRYLFANSLYQCRGKPSAIHQFKRAGIITKDCPKIKTKWSQIK